MILSRRIVKFYYSEDFNPLLNSVWCINNVNFAKQYCIWQQNRTCLNFVGAFPHWHKLICTSIGQPKAFKIMQAKLHQKGERKDTSNCVKLHEIHQCLAKLAILSNFEKAFNGDNT